MKVWVLTFTLLGCEVKEIIHVPLKQGTLLGELVFNAPNEVQPIDVSQYSYSVGTAPNSYTVTVRADSLMRLHPNTPRPDAIEVYTDLFVPNTKIRFIDILNTRPLFRWKPTGKDLVAMAIFKKTIKIDGNQITNSVEAVWRWDSSFPTGKDGEVSYNDGRRINSLDNTQKPIYINEKVPTKLPIRTQFVWCVWAWDDEGINIRYSSRELPFRTQ